MHARVIEMSKKKPRKRIKIKGRYMQVRQRSSKKGKKGTIMGKWKPKRGNSKTCPTCGRKLA
jgi:hypothetical protein